MRCLLISLCAIVSLALHSVALDGYTVPPDSPGYQNGNSTQAIQFDQKSLFIDGKRVFLLSGEFHPWRLPVPALWSDILQKMKAAGFNCVSIYINWGLVEGKPGAVDWGYWRDLELFYQIAQRVRMHVMARPGPYINAETTGGGLPAWLTNFAGTPRTNATDYISAWQNYIKQFAEITSPYQYPNGPVIAVQAENEFNASWSGNPSATDYMEKLETALRENGITRVPLTVNDAVLRGQFASGAGQVDIYGFDDYPNGHNCSTPEIWQELPDYAEFRALDPWGPMWLMEYQDGMVDIWSGPGYDGCYEVTNSAFADVFYKQNVAQGAKAMNFYMAYGGTNWGNSAVAFAYTSYDYGAAIRETRALTSKYNEIKLQGLCYHASTSLYDTGVVGNAVGLPYTANTGIMTSNLAAPNSSTNYYIVAQASNTVLSETYFTLSVNTTDGLMTIPKSGEIVLAGRESKILVTEYPFGNSTVRYSTAEVLTHTSFDGDDYIVLYVPSGQNFEALLHGPGDAIPVVKGSSSITATTTNGSVTISGSAAGVCAVRWGSTVAIVTDKATAKTFWAPKTVDSFDVSPHTPSVLLAGPYLVRNATVSGTTLHLVGDTNGTTALTVLAQAAVKSVTWNGATISISASSLGVGLSGVLPGTVPIVALPSIKDLPWKSADSIPEINPKFDDSAWTIANKTTTARPTKPAGGKYVLYGDEYGFHAASLVYRGYFNGSATGVTLTLRGGAASVWINGAFVQSSSSLAAFIALPANFTFPDDAVTSGQNVLTVLIDSGSMDENRGSDINLVKDPRGIVGYELVDGGDIDLWKIAGTFGGEDYPDKVRGPYNEGGLWAERAGATLPGFDDSTWNIWTPFDGIANAGVQVYRTSFTLDVPPDVDTSLAFKFTAVDGDDYECFVFVNGWNSGKYIPDLGPQTVFPIPEGILNHEGNNTLTLILWAFDTTGAKIGGLEVISVYMLESGKEAVDGLVPSPGAGTLRP